MVRSEVLAEILYKAYSDAEKRDHHVWPGGQSPVNWIQLPWDQRQQWRATAEVALSYCKQDLVEDWHGKATSSS
jgi:hypothetical protein